MSERRRQSANQQRRGHAWIARALRDDTAFQLLAPATRHILLDLKISFDASGIEVHYPAALHATLEQTTGWSARQVTASLDELERGGWIEREANVLWVVGQLERHPQTTPANSKHRTGVERHTDSLPPLAIVRRFTERYADFFEARDPMAPQGQSKTIRKVSPVASEGQGSSVTLAEDASASDLARQIDADERAPMDVVGAKASAMAREIRSDLVPDPMCTSHSPVHAHANASVHVAEPTALDRVLARVRNLDAIVGTEPEGV